MLRQLFGKSVLNYSRRLSNLIMAKREEIACRLAEQDLPNVYPRLQRYLELQIADNGANHFYSRYKLWELAELLREHRPQLIVEFGSGSTTAAFAEYLEENPTARVVSVDEYPPYHDQVFARLERAGFRPNERLIKCPCPKLIEVKAGKDVTRYEPNYLAHFAGQTPDLAYVDGPTTNHPEKPQANLPCVDAIFLCEQSLLPRLIAYDYRIPSVRAFLKSNFRYSYDAQLHYSAKPAQEEPWVVEKYRHHSLLRLNNSRGMPSKST